MTWVVLKKARNMLVQCLGARTIRILVEQEQGVHQTNKVSIEKSTMFNVSLMEDEIKLYLI